MFGDGAGFVDFVSEDHDRDFFELWHLEDALELVSALFEAADIAGIDQIDNPINI